MSSLTVNEILQYLPHRYPFMLIDRVLEARPGEYLHAIKNITFNEPQFTGHFPDMPVMPGVLLIEAMAQACGILYYLSLRRTPTPDEANYLVGVDNARFKQVVTPGDQVHLHITLVKSRSGISKFTCQAMVNDQVVCEAEIMNATRTKS